MIIIQTSCSNGTLKRLTVTLNKIIQHLNFYPQYLSLDAENISIINRSLKLIHVHKYTEQRTYEPIDTHSIIINNHKKYREKYIITPNRRTIA